ncbi:hypothetical protein [Ornithinibacillus scapharcae]|uniref:hypothetical protein n=1 Tax=Ornithinibacillus scapharcae TaxID=1147159 RepID=UPI000225BF25|nr:hypothetical protein [Ornithinibacillus scapharcae]
MNKEMEDYIIEKYQKDEKLMVLIFAQWCINHELNPMELYQLAYPSQPNNQALEEAIELTVPKNESDEISDETVLSVLQIFGNDDLAFVVQQEIEKRRN